MIILDEQLQGRSIEDHIARWYAGQVRFITELRPDTVIKDDAIPALLRTVTLPTFVTINEVDFWRRVAASDRYCIVCVAVTDRHVSEVPDLLRRLLTHELFSTKAKRVGLVIRLSQQSVAYYSAHDHATVHSLDWSEFDR